MYVFIDCLKAIATILIANSHMKGVYPSDIFSFGGGFGLSLFFLVSGFLLYPISENEKFLKWYFLKIIRLYIPLWIVASIEIICAYRVPCSVMDIIRWYVFPSRWFVGSMLIMYVVFYFYAKHVGNRLTPKQNLVIVFFIIGLYFIAYFCFGDIVFFNIEPLSIQKRGIETPYAITQLIWLCCMILGLYLKKIYKEEKNASGEILEILGVLLSTLVFLCVKLKIKSETTSLEVLLGPVYILFGFCAFVLFQRYEKKLKEYSKNKAFWIVNAISKSSLEIFYIQFIIIDSLRNLVFPINAFSIFLTSIIFGYLVKHVSDIFIKKIKTVC